MVPHGRLEIDPSRAVTSRLERCPHASNAYGAQWERLHFPSTADCEEGPQSRVIGRLGRVRQYIIVQLLKRPLSLVGLCRRRVRDALPLCENKVGWSLRPVATTDGVGVSAARTCSSSTCLTPFASTSDLATRSFGPVTSSSRNTGA